MKVLLFAVFCSLLTSVALATSPLLPKRATLISSTGEEAVINFSKFQMDQVTICEGTTSFVYGNEYQYRSSYTLEFNGELFNLYNHPCAQSPVNMFYYQDGMIRGAEFWFVKAGGRETLSISSNYFYVGRESTIETMKLFFEGKSFSYEINQTGTVESN